MDIMVKQMDVSVGTGQIIYPGVKVANNDTIFRVELPKRLGDRAAQLAYLVKLSPVDRSTWVRLFGYELAREEVQS